MLFYAKKATTYRDDPLLEFFLVLASLLRSVLTVAASMSSTLWLTARMLTIVLRSALSALLWLVAWLLTVVLRSALSALLWFAWLLVVVLRSMLATTLWWLMLVIWAISAIVWPVLVVGWAMCRSLQLVTRTVVVDILWSVAVAVVHTYIIAVYALSGVVVRLLVSNSLPVAVGDGCYRAAEDVG